MKKVLSGLGLFMLVVVALFLPGPASAAASPVWVANDGATIVSSSTVKLTGGNTSVEAADLNLTVAADTVVEFAYTLADGAVCNGGAPRVFMVVGGVNVNSWDQNIPDGVTAACAGAFKLPAGEVGAAGVVYDNGTPGTVTVTGLKVGGVAVDFKATTGEPDPTTSPSESASPTPTATVSPSASVTPTATASESVSPTTSPTNGPTVVTPAAPTVLSVDCEGVTYSAPTKGVSYDVSDYGPGWFVVVAKAEQGYVLAEGAQAEWRLTYTVPSCGSETPNPTPSTSDAAGGGSVGSGADGGGLPVTGAKVLTVAGVGGLLVAIGGLLLVGMRRKRDAEVEQTA